MARPLRIDLRNGWYHVTNRGNDRRPIYLDDRDRRHFLELLGRMTERYCVQVHAYVLMGNHYHLIVRTPEANLSGAIQWLNVAYSIWWNRRHQRSGHLFGGRFKAVLVEGGDWVLACSLYVHLNPVSVASLGLSKHQKAAEGKGLRKPERELLAKRLEKLRGYRWSSYPAYAGYTAPEDWLSTRELWERAGGREGYRRLAQERLGQSEAESLWSQVKWGMVLGGARFAEEARKKLKPSRESASQKLLRRRRSWGEVVAAVEKSRGEKWESFAQRHGDTGLAVALYVARRCSGLTLRELGEGAGGMDYAAVAAAVRRLEGKLPKDPRLRVESEEILRRMEK